LRACDGRARFRPVSCPGIPAPLGIGKLELTDGSVVNGFICEGVGVADAQDITEYGGWRAWLAER